MTTRLTSMVCAALLALAAHSAAPAVADSMSTRITYQGSLKDGGAPVNGSVDMRFTLYDADAGGNFVGTTAVLDGQPGNGAPVDVTDGLLTATPDFGADVFDGTALWLEIEVRIPHDPTDTLAYQILDPRQPISAAPIALQTRGLFVDENTGNVGIATTAPNQALDVAGNIHADGTITSGNTITIDGTSGAEKIVSGDALELHTGSGRVLRLEPDVDSADILIGPAPNVLGGWSGNTITPGVAGATISGGGADWDPLIPVLQFPNRVTDDHGTIGGGLENQAGDNLGTTTDAAFATVGGGQLNRARARHATIGGGSGNIADGALSTVGGGSSNRTYGLYSTVPGGWGNQAGGSRSFAAGRRAVVRNNLPALPYYSGDADGDEGTFVWADDTNEDFISTGPNQFLIRAGGGVGIGTNAPGEQLTVAGRIESTSGGFKFPDGSVQTTASTAGVWGASGADIYYTGGNVGIGTTSPPGTLTLNSAGNANVALEIERDELTYADTRSRMGISSLGGEPGLRLLMTADDGANWTDSLFIHETGRVGIGTTNPSGRLHVVDAAGGNGSVILPGNAVSALEILDEPGVCENDSAEFISMSNVVQTLRSATITAPAAGYALVIGTVRLRFTHTGGTTSTVTVGVSDSTGLFPANQNIILSLPPSLGGGQFSQAATPHAVFPVSAGANTFYLLGIENSGDVLADDMQLTVVYLPTAYGAVSFAGDEFNAGDDDDPDQARSPLSPEEIAWEQAEAQRLHEQRLIREREQLAAEIEELRALRAELEALRDELSDEADE